MSTHASHSHPELRRISPAESRALPSLLREFRENVLAPMPDACRTPDVACPLCGSAMQITLGRNSGAWFFAHPHNSCGESGATRRINAYSRAGAIERFLSDQTL